MTCTQKIARLLFTLITMISFCSCANDPSAPQKTYEVIVTMSFNEAMPLFNEVQYNARTRADNDDLHGVRYTLKAYRLNSDNEPELSDPYTFTFIENITDVLDETLSIYLPRGRFIIYAWVDFTRIDSKKDLFYDPTMVNNVAAIVPYDNDTAYRDAFSGATNGFKVSRCRCENNLKIEMTRPVARYEIYATDFAEFFNSENYYVRTRYGGYTPTNFNLIDDRAIDAQTGLTFSSDISPTSDSEALISTDYVFVDDETSVDVVLDIVDKATDRVMYSTVSLTVPLKRGHLTILRGKLLTQTQASGSGVVVNPTFDGETIIFLN